MKNVSRSLVAIAAFALVVTACGDSGTDPDSTAEQYRGDGFTIGIPADWFVIQPDDADGAALFETLDEEGIPFTAEELGAVWDQGGQLLAFDITSSPNPEFVDNVNILKFPPAPVGIDQLVETNLTEAEALGFVIREDRRLDVSGHPAHLIDYEWPAVGFEGITVTVLADDAQWQITLSADDTDRLRETFEAMVNSFETN